MSADVSVGAFYKKVEKFLIKVLTNAIAYDIIKLTC